MRKNYILTLVFLLVALVSKAQTGEAEMADAMRSNGKIYVVVLVLATIFAGIIALLVRMDRKITKLEKNK
jgi:heme/copper-type cytochrome/quinol oxidase subunit 2